MPLKNPPLLSVLIPCYNHEHFIEETVQSIWDQNIDNMEIIAIDDGSPDNTFKILQRLQAASPVEMYIEKQSNRGVVRTLNKALELSRGRYVALIASDDKYFPDALQPMIELMEQNPDLKVVYGNGRSWVNGELYGPVHNDYTRELLAQPVEDIARKIKLSVPRPLLTQCCLYDKELLVAIKGWDEDVALDDWPLNIKIFDYLNDNRLQHRFFDHDVVMYRDHDDNINKNTLKMLQLVTEVIEKYTPRTEQSRFLADELFGHGKYFLTNHNVLKGNQLIWKSIWTDFSFLRMLNSIRVLLKYNIKALLSKS